MLILGEKESEDGTIVSVRSRDKGDLGSIPTEKFIKDLLAEIESKEHA
jgi:threonyl-tRNA synthetase